MKIASFKKARETFDIEVMDVNGETSVFTLLPLPADLMQMVNVYITGGERILSQAQKLRYTKDCIVGWSNVKTEDGEDVPYDQATAMQLIESSYDELLTHLILESYEKKVKGQEKIKEDLDNLGKS